MSSVHPVIPIMNATAATACATGEVSIVAGRAPLQQVVLGSSCSAGGGAADSNDPEFKLAQEGWVLRTTIGEPRLSEVVDNYRSMGPRGACRIPGPCACGIRQAFGRRHLHHVL